tara:strand:+ start:20885 stop:21223 length:339 start_codon:yes stop_codon:yes gene_type:complete
MKRTNITCPACFKGKVLTTNDDTVNDNRTWCDNCGEDFILTSPTSLRFGVEPQPKKEKKVKVVTESKESEYHVTLYDNNEQSSTWVSIMASSEDEAAEMAISGISVTRVEKQ